MATRVKTTKFAFGTDSAGLAAATRRDQSAITLYIPEASPVFRHVFIDVYARQTDVAATSLTSWLIGIKLAAVAFDDVTVTDTITNSGEHSAWHFRRDVKSYFTTNWTGTSMTCQVGTTFGAVATIDITVEVTITYEYDDASSTTRIRTAEIPLDSSLVKLTNSLAEFGTTNQIPIVDNFTVENSPVIRSWYLRFVGSEVTPNNATDFALGVQIDSDAEVTFGLHESALISTCPIFLVYSRVGSVPTTSATHTLKARCAAVTGRFHFACVLVVTYEYNHTASSRLLNSIQLPMAAPGSRTGLVETGTGSTDAQRSQITFPIAEPGTITLLQSGVLIQVNPYNDVADGTLNVKCGGMTNRGFTVFRNGCVGGGCYVLSQRIDSGGAAGGGAGISLARGDNTFNVDAYLAAAGEHDPGFVLYLNYTSDKATGGDGAHNHTVEFGVADTAADATSRDVTFDPDIPEAAFRIVNVSAKAFGMVAAANMFTFWHAAYGGGEGAGEGWADITPAAYSDGEQEWGLGFINVTPFFNRWAGDPDASRMDFEASRTIRNRQVNPTWGGLAMLCTYHAIAFSSTINVINYTGDGSGITVDLHRDDTDEKVASGVTAAGGAVTLTWYQDQTVWTDAKQDGTHLGRSDTFTLGT